MRLVSESRGPQGFALLDALIANARFEVVDFSKLDLEFARDAFRRFGKGRHPAALNFGDCFSYALAKRYGEPLLFRGNDFSKTDIAPAI